MAHVLEVPSRSRARRGALSMNCTLEARWPTCSPAGESERLGNLSRAERIAYSDDSPAERQSAADGLERRLIAQSRKPRLTVSLRGVYTPRPRAQYAGASLAGNDSRDASSMRSSAVLAWRRCGRHLRADS